MNSKPGPTTRKKSVFKDVQTDQPDTRTDLAILDLRATGWNARIEPALIVLMEAYLCAQDVSADEWQFSVEIERLSELGLTQTECRWLVAKGLVNHAHEVTKASDRHRVFHHQSSLRLAKRSCFAITPSGLEYVRQSLQSHHGKADRTSQNHFDVSDQTRVRDLTPTWDWNRQQLRVSRIVVKRFKVPANNQAIVLSAFQEECWPPRIDDPLPPRSNIDPKRRLHDTINSLNRHQTPPLIRFMGDGRGEGIRWEFSDCSLLLSTMLDS